MRQPPPFWIHVAMLTLIIAVIAIMRANSVDTPISKVERIELVHRPITHLISEEQTEPTGEQERKMRDALDCDAPALVCCDGCDTCVCEPGKTRCPPMLRMYRCAP